MHLSNFTMPSMEMNHVALRQIEEVTLDARLNKPLE